MVSSVYIAKNVYGGDGLGRLGDGRVVFVPGAFAGEQVKAEIVAEKGSFVRARLVEVEDASPERISSAPEPVPGMVYSNLSLKGEIALKTAQISEALERARISFPKIVFGGVEGQALNYRNKTTYHFSVDCGRVLMGYHKGGSHEVADVENDPLARPEINAKLPEIRRDVKMLLTQGAKAVRKSVEKKETVTVRWTLKSGVQWWMGDAPKGLVLKETCCGRPFDVPADGFSQVNCEASDAMAKAIASRYCSWADEAPDIVDLYCGVGVLGLTCIAANRGKGRLFGVESGRQAVEFAKSNALRLGIKAGYMAGEVGRLKKRIVVSPSTTIIADPPRAGLERGIADAIASSSAPRVVMVGCDMATLTRDLRSVSRTYDVESVLWFNMFPRTARFETVVFMKKKSR